MKVLIRRQTGSVRGVNRATGVATNSDSHRTEFVRLRDVAFVLAVPCLLVAAFLLPESIRGGLVLSYERPTALAMYASHFVHVRASSLLSNLLVFFLVVPPALLASVRSGRRRRFYVVAFTVLVVFPFVLSVLNMLFPRPRVGMGFSGINFAFVGYLPHALADRFEADRPAPTRTARAFLPAVFFVGAAVVVLRMSTPLGVTPRAGGWLAAVGAGSVLAVGTCVQPVVRRPRVRTRSLVETMPPLVPFGSVLFVLVIAAGFPSGGYGGRVITNVFLHFLGYSFGYIVPYVVFRVLEAEFD
ncbi:hypothetical protein NDI76_15435 [Halogeometricum sp. S1BR25-6]|uniref:Uncharacterized protein n=1 Tax=Halogeometricum salsisoli TaxID=2950536 RepID=A0ABU2GH45_9EURY|nr:hypothetical protein [Halogeometricum sp. S1BR25-6]MDS0300138.1 hypothetical protein [Halogeometricum sp. S1BR25-6]